MQGSKTKWILESAYEFIYTICSINILSNCVVLFYITFPVWPCFEVSVRQFSFLPLLASQPIFLSRRVPASVAWQKANIKVIPSNHTSGKSYSRWMFHSVFAFACTHFFRSLKKPGSFGGLLMQKVLSDSDFFVLFTPPHQQQPWPKTLCLQVVWLSFSHILGNTISQKYQQEISLHVEQVDPTSRVKWSEFGT